MGGKQKGEGDEARTRCLSCCLLPAAFCLLPFPQVPFDEHAEQFPRVLPEHADAPRVFEQQQPHPVPEARRQVAERLVHRAPGLDQRAVHLRERRPEFGVEPVVEVVRQPVRADAAKQVERQAELVGPRRVIIVKRQRAGQPRVPAACRWPSRLCGGGGLQVLEARREQVGVNFLAVLIIEIQRALPCTRLPGDGAHVGSVEPLGLEDALRRREHARTAVLALSESPRAGRLGGGGTASGAGGGRRR